MHRHQADHSWEALMERGMEGTEGCTTDMMGLRKLKVSPVGEKMHMNTLLATLIFSFFGFHKRETICVVCNGERQIQEELQVFLEAEERGRDPVLNSALFLGSEAWLQWSSVRGLLCRAGLSLGTQA